MGAAMHAQLYGLVGQTTASSGSHGNLVSMVKHSVSAKALASLIAQLVKNPPAMQETLVQFLGWQDPLVKR